VKLMHNLYYKLAAGAGAAFLATALFAGSAFAADLEIKDNGALSKNTIEVVEVSECTVVQGTETNVMALVGASASTGGNSALFNTGGNTTVQSGNASATATMTVTGGSNTATDPCCCEKDPCEGGGYTAKISDNGAFSWNTIGQASISSSLIVQGSSTNVGAIVGAKAKTGKNKAWFNTGGTTMVKSGSATSSSSLSVSGGSNNLP
jgi:hypothetical protein